MAFKSVALPLLSGVALLAGYAALSRRRRPRQLPQYSDRRPETDVEPLSARLEHVSEQQAIDPELDRDVSAPQSNEHASEFASDIRALFIARVTEALCPFPAHPNAVKVGKAS